MKLYKLSILALALAGTMAACSDDDYTAPAATPGAFFPVESPDVVELPFDGNSVDITIRRTSNIPSDETVKLNVTDASGLFNIPTSVTFIGQETTAQIHVTYDASKIVTDQAYPVTIAIEGVTNNWGLASYEFSFERITPIQYTEMGESQWIYNGLLTGGGVYDVVKEVNPLVPNIETYIVKGWFDYPAGQPGVDLRLTVHTDKVLPNGYPWVELPWTSTGFVNNGELIKVTGWADMVMEVNELDFAFLEERGFSLKNSSGGDLLTPAMMSYFDTDRGSFYLYNRYEAFDPGTGEDLGGWAAKPEYLYLPGYPDYDLEINYLGFFTDADDVITAIGELYAGADIETVDLYNVQGDDVEAIFAQISNGTVEPVMSLEPDNTETIQVKCSVPGAGTYTMFAVAYGNGDMQNLAYSTYTIAGGAPVAGNWESIGVGTYVDGWVLPAYGSGGVQINPFDEKYIYGVEIEKNLDVAGEYRMVNPYGSENFYLISKNKNTKATNIVFNIADPDWPTVPFQASGFSDGHMEWISDANWFFENVLGYSKDQILGSTNRDKASYYEGGVLEIVLPLFAMDDSKEFSSNLDDLGYNWQGGYPSQLTFPEATQGATVAKAIRKAVSNDHFVRSLQAEKVNIAKHDRKALVRVNTQMQPRQIGELMMR